VKVCDSSIPAQCKIAIYTIVVSGSNCNAGSLKPIMRE